MTDYLVQAFYNELYSTKNGEVERDPYKAQQHEEHTYAQVNMFLYSCACFWDVQKRVPGFHALQKSSVIGQINCMYTFLRSVKNYLRTQNDVHGLVFQVATC